MSLFLDNVLKGIHNSVVQAQKISEQQHMRTLSRYFYMNEYELKQENLSIEDLGMPKTVKIQMPFIKDNEVIYKSVDIPILALNAPSSIKIKAMKVSFEAKITSLSSGRKHNGLWKQFPGYELKEEDEDIPNEGSIELDLNASKDSAGMAKIEIEFFNSEIPEVFAKVNDHIIKSLPI